MDYIVVVNKTDIERKIDLNRVHELAGKHRVVSTSL